jgi:hypothetical protein
MAALCLDQAPFEVLLGHARNTLSLCGIIRTLPLFASSMSSVDSFAIPIDAPSKPSRPAATIVVVRDGADGVEVLLVLRAERGDFNSGAWVFSGIDAARVF